MTPRLLSVNLAVPGRLRARGRDVPSGIFKEPAAGRIPLHRESLEGDVQVDRRYHGGPEKAVYAYSSEHNAYWSRELGRDEPLPPGYFGENFTTRGLLEDDVALGDAFRIGTARVQITTPRSPCFKLGLRVGSARFLKAFLASGRLGFYLRVLQEGDVGAGDAIERIDRVPNPLKISDLIRLLYFHPVEPSSLERALEAGALGAGLRRQLQERLGSLHAELF
ncbi:MAG: MOSC domain-containing protein [Acidobacteria bacterium]|nr:MOSC domain-containing protein [Acidobacteriota bacterium]MCA1610583.1 MOSC domain-containing protein [Acidobacteriota bacterium]